MSLLDAAASAGIFLPYSCKVGRCSTCKCKVITGKTKLLMPESGLAEQEKADGWVLSCVRSAESDVTLEAGDLSGVPIPKVKTLPCRISQLERLAPDVIRVKLRLPPTANFSFIPGQYIDVIGPNGLRRSYSLANSGFSDEFLELHIRAVSDGAMSEYWFQEAKINDLLRFNGPLGTFFLRGIANMDLFFLATGTGIAPVKAMLESLSLLMPEEQPRSVTVLWGGRKSQDFYWDVAQIPGGHSYVPVCSRPDATWQGATGYVQQVLLDRLLDWKRAVIFACGSHKMIRDAQNILVKAGLPANNFYSDAFVCSSSL